MLKNSKRIVKIRYTLLISGWEISVTAASIEQSAAEKYEKDKK